MTDLEVFSCRLHRDRIALYEAIHDGMTPAHAAGIRRGYECLDIYRLDDLLVMLTRRKPAAPEPTAEDRERAAQWHASLAECFAEPWKKMPPIFLLTTAGDGEMPADKE